MIRPPARVRPFAVAAAIALAGAALPPAAARAGAQDAAPADRAVLDDVAAGTATGTVSTALSRVFTYTPGDTATAERAAAQALTGAASEQYRRLFDQVKRQAPGQRLALTTRVVRAGVTALEGDTARLLVFLDQTATRAGRASGTPAAAQLAVTARFADGRWLITDIRSG